MSALFSRINGIGAVIDRPYSAKSIPPLHVPAVNIAFASEAVPYHQHHVRIPMILAQEIGGIATN
jgi:hypothetical protein